MKNVVRNVRMELAALCFAALVAELTPTKLQAQATTEPAAPPPQETIKLSPFVVNSDKDTGYAAQETLSGTRLRTDLRDTPSAMSVMTPEFMADLAASSPTDAMLFTPSVNDYSSGDNTGTPNRLNGSFIRFGSGQPYTVRGFNTNEGIQPFSFDFFTQPHFSEPVDNYNLERATISRGPNSLLFGVGGPSGDLELTLKHARLDKTMTHVETRGDGNGSHRVALDHNHVLIKNKLAIRINALDDEFDDYRKGIGTTGKRYMLGLTYQPFANTTVRVDYEDFHNGANVSPNFTVMDNGVLGWLAAGKPTINFHPTGLLSNGTTYLGPDGTPYVYTANPIYYNQVATATPTIITGLPLANPIVNERYQVVLNAPTFSGTNNGHAFSSLNPFALLGISPTANLIGGTVHNPSQVDVGHFIHLVIQQELAQDLFLEIGGQLLTNASQFTPDYSTGLSVDLNQYSPDGSLNPGYLKPYVAQFPGQYRYQHDSLSEVRATLSYQLDLRKRNKWLGHHSFAVLVDANRDDYNPDTQQIFNLATVGNPNYSTTALNNANILGTRSYIINGVIPPLPTAKWILQNLATINSYGYMVGNGTANSGPVNFKAEQFTPNLKSRTQTYSISGGMQNTWLNDRLITLFGVRRDEQQAFVPAAASVKNAPEPLIPGSSVNTPALNFYPTAASLTLPSEPSEIGTGNSVTTGAVVHATSWIDLTFNRSQNFQIAPTPGWLDAQGKGAANSIGYTKEYGVRFYLLDQKLAIGVNHFSNSASNVSQTAPYTGNMVNILNQLRTGGPGGTPLVTGIAPVGSYVIESANSDTSSTKASGYELNITFNPTRNWRFAVTGSSVQNLGTAGFPSEIQYMNTVQPFQGTQNWTNYISELTNISNGIASTVINLDPTVPANRTLAATNANLIQGQLNTILNGLAYKRALIGAVTSHDGKYSLNGLGAYSFTEGKLTGLTIGGNFRWRSRNTAGYQSRVIYAGPNNTGAQTVLPILSEPVYGASFLDLGAMASYRFKLGKLRMQAQLNVQNLQNDTKVRLVQVGLDTNAVYGTTNALVSTGWATRAPRNYILSVGADF